MTEQREFAVSGRPVTIEAAVPTLNTTTIRNWLQVMQWERFQGPMPVDLQLDVRLPTSAAGGFPEIDAINFCAGGYYVTGGPYSWDDSAEGCVALKIELGTGMNPRTIYADCRGGRFSLGSNNFVRVSVARWLAAGNSPAIVQAGISPSDGSGEYLTYSAVIDAVAAAGSAVLAVPPGAAWWDFYGTDGSSWSAISMDNSAPWVARRFQSATPGSSVYDPPTSPMPLLGSNGIVLTNNGAAAAGVTACFWIR